MQRTIGLRDNLLGLFVISADSLPPCALLEQDYWRATEALRLRTKKTATHYGFGWAADSGDTNTSMDAYDVYTFVIYQHRLSCAKSPSIAQNNPDLRS